MVVIDILIQNKLDEIKKSKEDAKLKGYKYIVTNINSNIDILTHLIPEIRYMIDFFS